MLHVAIAARAEGPEEKVAKRTVISALLRLGFVLDDTNMDGKTCKDMCPQTFEKDMRGGHSTVDPWNAGFPPFCTFFWSPFQTLQSPTHPGKSTLAISPRGKLQTILTETPQFIAELEDQRQKKARGNSIYAEYRTFQNVAEAGFMAFAAVSFFAPSQKNLQLPPPRQRARGLIFLHAKLAADGRPIKSTLPCLM